MLYDICSKNGVMFAQYGYSRDNKQYQSGGEGFSHNRRLSTVHAFTRQDT